jgi:hypothetical protein
MQVNQPYTGIHRPQLGLVVKVSKHHFVPCRRKMIRKIGHKPLCPANAQASNYQKNLH